MAIGFNPFIVSTDSDKIFEPIIYFTMQMPFVMISCLLPFPYPELAWLKGVGSKEIAVKLNIGIAFKNLSISGHPTGKILREGSNELGLIIYTDDPNPRIIPDAWEMRHATIRAPIQQNQLIKT